MNLMKRQVDRIERFFLFAIAIILRPFVRVKKNRIICWSFNFNKYACNPRAISEYLLKYHLGEFEIFWAFKDDKNIEDVDDRINIVKKNSINYILVLYSSRFVITNMRNDYADSYFIKKKNQKYIMTWHGSFSLKRIEKDVSEILGSKYIRRAKLDSKMCDIMLSSSKFHTELFKRSFWYNGEIMEKGTPRCDFLFENHYSYRKVLLSKLGIPLNKKILLYAPTFRSNYSLDSYKLKWNSTLQILNDKFQSEFVILIKLHPNFIGRSNNSISELIDDDNIKDFTLYPDIQELLAISDIFVTDYSSAMYDFSLMGKPCFIYANDVDTYDRGFYFKIKELPYPYATNEQSFDDLIKGFNKVEYIKQLEEFFNKIGNFEKGNACDSLYQWIKHFRYE